MVRGECSACLVALNKKTFKNKLEEKRFVHKFIFNKLFFNSNWWYLRILFYF